ncbi:MAG: hypothetical protein KW793_02220 [Candidatus Doudnabacteria bacterium]|nr:hypothetical protein [Candidatus Doudnabacteria bacterium]
MNNYLKITFIIGLIGASMTVPLLVGQANASWNISYAWIQADDYEQSPCMRPGQTPLLDGKATFVAKITNHENEPILINKAAFHDPISGCAPTVDTLRQDVFSTSGKTYYNPGEDGEVTFDFDVNSFNCGRAQIDAGFTTLNPEYESSVFLGEVIDYGVDCGSNPPPPETGSCIENAALTASQIIPSRVVAGDEIPFAISLYNSGETWFYHGSYFQLVQTSNMSINPPYGHLSPSVNLGETQERPFTLTAPSTAGTYSISFQMVHRAGADYLDSQGRVCAPAPSSDVYFGNQLSMTFEVEPNDIVAQGNVIVISDLPTNWSVTGTQNFSGTGTYASYLTDTGSYNLVNVPQELTQGTSQYKLLSITPNSTQALTEGSTIVFEIKYETTIVINNPNIILAGNQTCGQLKLSWEDKSDNEIGFYVYRSEQENGGNLDTYQKIATLPANTTTYSDKPATGKSYFYIVAAFSNTPAAKAQSSPFKSDFNQVCSATISAEMSIIAVDGKQDFNVIQDNDSITIQILIDNLGPAEGYITKITDQMSDTLKNPRNLTVTGLNSIVGSPAISGSYPDMAFNVSGKKDVGGLKWVIRFDATVDIIDTIKMGEFSNCAVIHYFDDSGTNSENVCMKQILANDTQSRAVDFKEVAP